MLTNSRLQKHPKIQENLINDLVLKTNKEAKHIVAQKIMDGETGYLIHSEKDDTYYFGDSDKRDLIKDKVVKHHVIAYVDIIKSIDKLCNELTGHKLEKDEFEFNLLEFINKIKNIKIFLKM